METYWYQLQGRPGDKGLFWGLNFILLLAIIFILTGETENAPWVAAAAAVVQGFNVGVTYFSKEQRRKRV
ncbi:hypothetical protein MUN82_03845 [Hymenobacter aerilatus]|uniref:Uncharacterized protein n=1 Tax=Hymenobacter aerilatus TaxID=2932251 RepID=A0A8T9SXX1_9BACT|nr:hypothetical protein [Hymenobacter aerilatus]UOR06231.1 hypothetical protein MUN82_03845 [Hymenobacter aerilatus]